jgi:hypothetical protein
MSLVGKTVTIVDEETGDGTTIEFTNTPLNRFVGGVYSAAETFGLGRDEAAVVVHFCLFASGETCAVPKSSLPPYLRRPMKALLKRGWVSDSGRLYHLLDKAQPIMDAAESAV